MVRLFKERKRALSIFKRLNSHFRYQRLQYEGVFLTAGSEERGGKKKKKKKKQFVHPSATYELQRENVSWRALQG